MTIPWHRHGLLALCGLALLACSQPSRKEPAPTAVATPTAGAEPPYLAMARGKVDIEGGLLNVSTARDGVFSSVNVKAGDKVRHGDLLGQLDSQAATLGIGMAQAEVQHAEAELTVLTARLPATQQAAQRWQEAAKVGAAEQQQADNAVQASTQLQAEITVARATVALARQKLLQARHELELQRVLAPADAEVTKVLVQPGSTVSLQDHQTTFVLLPKRPLIIRAEVNESYISRIKTGLAAQVSLEANPGQPALKARVVRVGRVLEAGHLSEEPQMTRAFECTLQLEENPAALAQDLRIGQTVLVKFND